jgi:TfoX/Sxy family transcriptional regulator of competence genes
MAYDEGVAQRVREALQGADASDVDEKRMFGGLAFLRLGHMCVGVVGEELMVRVGPDGYRDALDRPHAREMDFTGRPLKGFVFVEADGFESDDDLADWIGRGLRFVDSLPPKVGKRG